MSKRFEKAIENLTRVVVVATKHIDNFEIKEKTTNNFKEFMKQGYPLQISSEGCDNTIYGNRYINQLARVWHGYYHLEQAIDFSLQSEIDVFEHQKQDIINVIQRYSTREEIADAIELLRIDIVEQAKYYDTNHKFLDNQYNFAKRHFELYENKEKEESFVIIQTTKEEYHFFKNRLDDEKKMFLDETIYSDYYYLAMNIETDETFGGFAISITGRLQGLFSLQKGFGKRIFESQLEIAKATSNALQLECIGDDLKKLYTKYGFWVYNSLDWDMRLAPKNWNAEKFGYPNIYRMVWRKK